MFKSINDFTPLNLREEKNKFFNDFWYNPQFVYKDEINKESLTLWGIPKENYYQHALEELKLHPKGIPHGTIVTEADVVSIIENYNIRFGFDPKIEVTFSDMFPVRCSVTLSHIRFGLPLTYTNETLQDLCRHEIETHILRILNNNKQPWAHEPPNELLFRRTEEGLANIHTHLFRSDKIIYKTYRTYVATYLAQQHSFSEVFHILEEMGVQQHLAWLLTLRTKRGLTDTAQKGGVTKDICYFEGVVDTWNWIHNLHNDPHDLYLGRIDISQVTERKKIATAEGLIYPELFSSMDEYYSNIMKLGEINHLEELL